MELNEPKGLVEALESFQPKSLSAATWERYRLDAVELVRRIPVKDARDGTRVLSHIALVVADLAAARPGAVLADLMTPAILQGYLERCQAEGQPPTTLLRRQATLNKILAVVRGETPPPPGRSPEPHRKPYTDEELESLCRRAAESDSYRAGYLLQVIAVAMAGHTVPPRSSAAVEEIAVEGSVVVVGCGDDRTTWRPPVPFPDEVGGRLDATAARSGQKWAREALGFPIHVRRLELTRIRRAIEWLPAREAARMGVGRDGLTAAVAHARRPSHTDVRSMLTNA